MAVRDQLINEKFAIYNADCMAVMEGIPDDSIGLSVYSPPFGGLYCYSSDERDLSNNASYGKFFDHYGYIIREKLRITMPGRMTVVHCADIPSGNSGGDHIVDFTGDIIRAHQDAGWKYVARYSVWKEPLGVRNRTMRKDLAHRTLTEDSSRCSCASADYMLVFRAPGENPEPITHPNGLLWYAGERTPPADVMRYRGWEGNQIQNRYSHWVWRQYASSFWDDVRIGRVLPYKKSRSEDDEKHVHPLQLDAIERAIVLWSNEGDKVFTPFMGVGSEVYCAVRLGRLGIGVELKPAYFVQAKRNLETVEVMRGDNEQADLFATGLAAQ